MARLLRSHSDATDRFFRIVSGEADSDPVVQYFWFDSNGWLLGLIKLFVSGRAEIETATEAFPLSIGPIEPNEFTSDWPDGAAGECSAIEYFAIDALVTLVQKGDSPGLAGG